MLQRAGSAQCALGCSACLGRFASARTLLVYAADPIRREGAEAVRVVRVLTVSGCSTARHPVPFGPTCLSAASRSCCRPLPSSAPRGAGLGLRRGASTLLRLTGARRVAGRAAPHRSSLGSRRSGDRYGVKGPAPRPLAASAWPAGLHWCLTGSTVVRRCRTPGRGLWSTRRPVPLVAPARRRWSSGASRAGLSAGGNGLNGGVRRLWRPRVPAVGARQVRAEWNGSASGHAAPQVRWVPGRARAPDPGREAWWRKVDRCRTWRARFVPWVRRAHPRSRRTPRSVAPVTSSRCSSARRAAGPLTAITPSPSLRFAARSSSPPLPTTPSSLHPFPPRRPAPLLNPPNSPLSWPHSRGTAARSAAPRPPTH